MIFSKKGYEMNIEWLDSSAFAPAPWRTTYVLKPDMNVLIQSLTDYGWLSPIIVREKTLEIIDGFHRLAIANNHKPVRKRDKGLVPVVMIDCSEVDAMMMHVRLNRGRGAIVAKDLSHLVREVLRSGKYSEDDIMEMLGMSVDEFGHMRNGSMIKAKKMAEHQYSKAWVPVEAPANIKEQAGFIERPPNADR